MKTDHTGQWRNSLQNKECKCNIRKIVSLNIFSNTDLLTNTKIKVYKHFSTASAVVRDAFFCARYAPSQMHVCSWRLFLLLTIERWAALLGVNGA